ncbi:unnamed protein product, partial [Rotaria magnacalcarata]
TSLLYLNVIVNNKLMTTMIDTGANRTFISIKALHLSYKKQSINKVSSRVILADGYTSLSILGTVHLSINMGDILTTIKAFIVKELCVDCILGIILGTTTIPTLSFKKYPDIDYSLAQKHICNLIQPITNLEQKDNVKRVLEKHVKLFDTTKPTIVINVKPHAIKTLDYPPPSSKPYYFTSAKQDAMYKITQELLQFELIRPSYSPYAA